MSDSDFMPTVDAVVEWFMCDKHGNRLEEPDFDEADLRALVVNMTTLPDPYDDVFHEPLTPAGAWNAIIDDDLLYLSGKLGWIDRTGKMFTCGWAKHDKLLAWMGKNQADVERDGWIRVNRSFKGPTYRSCFKASSAQRKKLRSLGIEIDRDVERALPAWTEQNRASPLSFENVGTDANDYNNGPK
jgi:hypothetical protein